MSFGEGATAAIQLAREGFVMYPLMAALIATFAEEYSRWPSSAEVCLPSGKPPSAGNVFVQADLARTLQYMVDEEAAQAVCGREAGPDAARGIFCGGDIARTIVGFHEANDGLLGRLAFAGLIDSLPAQGAFFAGADPRWP